MGPVRLSQYEGLALCVPLCHSLLPGPAPENAEDRIIACFTSWGRCTRWSSWATGWLWQTCDDKCKKGGVYTGGHCVHEKSKCPLASKAWYCKCYGFKG